MMIMDMKRKRNESAGRVILRNVQAVTAEEQQV